MEDLRSDALLAKTTEVKGYKILPPCVLYARIGSGGMGAVYRGHHLNLDIEVAIKCLKPNLVADDPTFVERFKREGRSAAKINHQNVIRVFDVAENLGLHYLIMEFVSGETARQRVERKGALDVSEALQIVYESSLGLGEAHRMGIIHRDVKPDNLLISSRGQVKVADLGLAKPAVSSGQSMLSMAGQVMGTPPYMPPEQWGEGTVTAASDVWAMGAVLYYLLTACEAMGGESLAAIMSKIVLQDFPDVRALNPTVPDEVVAVLQKATAKAPGDRYLDAYALADAIAQLPQHRISLADTDAGTTELRTMLSPPPNVRFDEIKELLRTRASTGGGSVPGEEPAVVDDAGGGRFPWVAVLLVLLLVGGGGAGYVYRDQLFGKEPDQPNALAVAERLARDGRSVAALKAARSVFAADATTMDAKLLGTLREDAADQLQAVLTRVAPTADEAVEKGAEVRFAGRLVGVQIDELVVGGVAATFTGDDFVASVVVPASGEVAIEARVTAEDTIDLEPWSVAFREEPAIKPAAKPDRSKPNKPNPEKPKPLPVAFDGGLTTEPKLGERNTVGELSITVLGRASERDLELRLQGKAIAEDKVTWQADGSFRAEVDLPSEGANTIALTVARSGEPAQGLRAEQTRSIEVIRLTKPPTIDLVSPATEVSTTTATEFVLEVTSGEWTESVSARAGAQVVEFQKGATKAGKTTWRAQRPLELDDNENSVTITARNLTRKEREQPLTITCEAKPLEITAIDLAVAGTDVPVKPGATVFVNKQPEVKISVSDGQAKVFLGGKLGVKRFPANLVAGQPQKYSVRAQKGLRESQLWTFTVVYDTKGPAVSCDKVAPVPPGTEVTLRGTFTDDFGIGSVVVDAGGKAKLTGSNAKSGRWSTRVRVGDASSTFTVVALDLAGNRSSVAVPVTVVKPEAAKPVVLAPEKPKPTSKPASKPVVKLSAKINTALFAPVGKLNQMGFPPELRHKATGITLLAVNFVDTMDPSYYVAKRAVTNQQWDGDTGSGTGPKVSVRWMDVARKVNSERFEGLAMVTKQQWQMVRNGKVTGIVLDEKAEWLAQAAGDSLTMRAIGNRANVQMIKHTDSNGFIGFRVGFKP